MFRKQQTQLILIYIVIFSVNIVFTHCCDNEEFYIIRSTAQHGLVLDGSDATYIKIQPFAGFDTQFWKMEPGSTAGQFYIINKCTGTVLDIEYVNAIGSWKTILRKRNDSLNQQWVLKDNGRIMNAAKLYNLDIYNAQYQAGSTVNIWKDNGNLAQQYILQKTPNCSKCDMSQHL